MNAFYQRYFLSKRGFELPPEEQWENDSLGYMAMTDLKAEFAATQLGISPLWLTAIPVVFTTNVFGMYVCSGEFCKSFVTTNEGIIIKNPSETLRSALDKIILGRLEPLPVPEAKPYAMLRAAIKMKKLSIDAYIRRNFQFPDRQAADILIRDVYLSACTPSVGKMDIVDHEIIRKFAKEEDITIDEACSGFEVENENCFINLLIAFRLCIATPTIANRKDGSILISYPGYKMSDFGDFLKEHSNKGSHRGSPSLSGTMPIQTFMNN